MSDELPLVTFALFAYNQEKYIREAVEAALAQDYPNLEIIISDDASSDGTWVEILQVTRGYDGPHRVRLNRNPENLGIGAHVSAVFEMAAGRLVVLAAGDDVSTASRVRLLVKEWIDHGSPDGAVHSASEVIDSDGNLLGKIKVGKGSKISDPTLSDFIGCGFSALIHGATAAYTRSIYSDFGPIAANIEDIPLTFRALLKGKIVFVDQVLVRYRVDGFGQSRHFTLFERKHCGRLVAAQVSRVRQHIRDYQRYHNAEALPADQGLLDKLHGLQLRYERALGVATRNPLRILYGLYSYPVQGTMRDRLYFYAKFFGIK